MKEQELEGSKEESEQDGDHQPGYQAGHPVFFTGDSRDPLVQCIARGTACMVVDSHPRIITVPPQWGLPRRELTAIQVAAPVGLVDVPLELLDRNPPPPLLGGFRLGESLYFAGAVHSMPDFADIDGVAEDVLVLVLERLRGSTAATEAWHR